MKRGSVLAGILVFTCIASVFADSEDIHKTGNSFTKSIGMKFVRIEPAAASPPVPVFLPPRLPTRVGAAGDRKT